MKAIWRPVEILLILWDDYPWAFGIAGLVFLMLATIFASPLLSGDFGYVPQRIFTSQDLVDVRVARPRDIIVGKEYIFRLYARPGSEFGRSVPITSSLPVRSTICLSSPLLRNTEETEGDCISATKELSLSSTPLSQELHFEALGTTDDKVSLSVTIEPSRGVYRDSVAISVNRLSTFLRVVISGITGLPGLVGVAGALIRIVLRGKRS